MRKYQHQFSAEFGSSSINFFLLKYQKRTLAITTINALIYPLPRNLRTFCVIKIYSQTIVIDNHGIHNAVSTDRETLSWQPKRLSSIKRLHKSARKNHETHQHPARCEFNTAIEIHPRRDRAYTRVRLTKSLKKSAQAIVLETLFAGMSTVPKMIQQSFRTI